MRFETSEILTKIANKIELSQLMIEGTQDIQRLITVLEDRLFTETFEPKLQLRAKSTSQEDKEKVEKDQRAARFYKKRIDKAIDLVSELIEKAEEKERWGEEIGSDFPKKTESIVDTILALTQLRALLQTYLDLFNTWENKPNKEIKISPKEASKKIQEIEKSLSEILIGQEEVVRHLLIAFFAGGHVLLEGNSGLGKTKLAKSLKNVLGLESNRIQGTLDLTASDILEPPFHRSDAAAHSQPKDGPIHTNILFFDEINRTPPKTQAALLEAMEEKQVTNGKTRQLPEPFFVIATQNNISAIGTNPLPDAQLDRFAFKILMNFPDLEELSQILQETLAGKEY